MVASDLFAELRRLSRADKLRAMQFLANELAAEEALLSPNGEYQIYTPVGNEAAAKVLWDVLQEANATDDNAES